MNTFDKLYPQAKKLRLLVTRACDRNCPKCANKNHDLDALPVITGFGGFEEVILTGGEPMLKPELVLDTITAVRVLNPDAKIYVYTARVGATDAALDVAFESDGMTVTLHEQADVEPFLAFAVVGKELLPKRNMRLHVFEGIKLPFSVLAGWKLKRCTWVDDCPVPEDEVFGRLPGA